MAAGTFERIEPGRTYLNNWKDRILMYGFDEADVKFYSRMTDKKVFIANSVTDLIAFGARMVLVKDGPPWQKEKWQVEDYLKEFGDREQCHYCVVQVL